jgi:hypothetical protein
MDKESRKAITSLLGKLTFICERYKVEVNINATGDITLYAELPGGIDVEYQHIAVKDISGAIEQLNDFRRSGWTGN